MQKTVAALATMSVFALAPFSAQAKDYTQIGTAIVSNVNSKDATCKPVSGQSATGTATAKSVHQACTDAKNNARATLRNAIPGVCAKYISSNKPCKNG